MKQLSNHEKALMTVEILQERRKTNKAQLAKEVAKLARKKDKEATEYSIDNVARVKRRMR